MGRTIDEKGKTYRTYQITTHNLGGETSNHATAIINRTWSDALSETIDRMNAVYGN